MCDLKIYTLESTREVSQPETTPSPVASGQYNKGRANATARNIPSLGSRKGVQPGT